MVDRDRTKKEILKALIEITEETEFEKVSVRQICEKASMSRQTFYQYFKDKYDAAYYITEQVLQDNFQRLGSEIGWREAYLNTFKCMESMSAPLARLGRSDEYNSIRKATVRNSRRDFQDCYLRLYGQKPSALIAFQMDYFSRSATEAPSDWIENGCVPPADVFIDYFITLIPAELKACLEPKLKK